MCVRVCVYSQQCLWRLVGIQCLNPGFLVEGNLPSCLHHLSPHMPHFTKQVGVPLSLSSGWSRLLSPDGPGRRVQRRDPPGRAPPLPSTSFHTLRIYLTCSFPQRPPVSEWALCSASCSRTLRRRRKMRPTFETFNQSARPLAELHTHTSSATCNFIKYNLIDRLLWHTFAQTHTPSVLVNRAVQCKHTRNIAATFIAPCVLQS